MLDPVSSPGAGADSDRGQSELVGFILIFGVVTLAIALVGLTGFIGLDSAQDFQRTTNAEQTFTALAGNVDDVVRGGAPSRGTEVRVADARLALEETENITIEADGSTLRTVETQPIVYDSGSGTTLTYHTGALIREDDGNALMFREPRFVITESEVVLPIVNTTQVSGGPIGGTRDINVRTRNAGTDVDTTGVADNVTLNISTSHPDVWRRYFEGRSPVSSIDADADSVEVVIDTDRVQVTDHRVDVTFE